MSTWADEYVTMLEDCEKRSEKLTDWECGFVDSLQRQIAPHRAALDVILGEGTLASRLLRAAGPNPDAAALTKTYRRLCDCLAHGRMFRAGDFN